MRPTSFLAVSTRGRALPLPERLLEPGGAAGPGAGWAPPGGGGPGAERGGGSGPAPGGRRGARGGRSMAGMEPWKQCGQWLISCKVLPPNHRVTWDTAQVFDLAQTLRDGVLLCQLLNNLRGHSINLKEINLRPQMSQVRPGGLGVPALPSSPPLGRRAGRCPPPPRGRTGGKAPVPPGA